MYHDPQGTQDISNGTQDIPHGTQDIPHSTQDNPTALSTPKALKIPPGYGKSSTVQKISLTVLNISPHSTQHIPSQYSTYPLTVLNVSPTLLNNPTVLSTHYMGCQCVPTEKSRFSMTFAISNFLNKFFVPVNTSLRLTK